ncbi:MAG TPA: type II secretion system protein GspJ [Sedimentisphaerales bacterium]|nr:type II secretion system protein GspJ [Sedimentisphaerales bacterium]HRS10152.1 type II secretion system protein GspJ [Sedimentisphaerales bacterium]HRV46858.1 type II secretion system protein GspJ [Sedimentisphaerales bacterium]
MSEQPRNPGFTLVEMLVALALIATIVSMVYGSYAATSRSADVYDSRLTCSQRADLVLRLLARQLRCAYRPPAEPNAMESSRTAEIHKPGPAFLGGTRNPRGEVLDFLTTAPLGGGPNGPQGLARVTYQHDSAMRTLAIQCRPATGSIHPADGAGQWQVVLRQVVDIEIEFHDGLQWQPHWNSATSRNLPRAVRLGLTVMDREDRAYHCATTVAIWNDAGNQKNVRQTR